MHSNWPHSRSEVFYVEDCDHAAVSCDHLEKEYQGTRQLFVMMDAEESNGVRS